MKVKDHRNLPDERIEIEQHYGLNEHDALKFLAKGFTVTSENSYYAFRHRSSQEIEELQSQRDKEKYINQYPLTPDESYTASSIITKDVEPELKRGYLCKDVAGVTVQVPDSPEGYELLSRIISMFNNAILTSNKR